MDIESRNTRIKELEDQLAEKEVLRSAASIERHSDHPIAKGIVSAAEVPWPVDGFRAIKVLEAFKEAKA